MEHELLPTTKHIYTRRYKVFLTDEQIQAYNLSVEVQNSVHNFAVRYLEAKYGRRHLKRRFPNSGVSKQYLTKEIKLAWIKEVYGLTRWSFKVIGCHSQAIELFLGNLIANFSIYRKTLIKTSKWDDEKKATYTKKYNRAWYCRGSLNYLRPNRSHKTVALPNNNQIEVISAHHIKIQHFGIVRVRENIAHIKYSRIAVSKIKKLGNDTYELQLLFDKEVKRVNPVKAVGADWGMYQNKIWHTSENQEIYLDPVVSDKADQLEELINKKKSERDTLLPRLGRRSNRIKEFNAEIKFLYTKRTNILNEFYKQVAIKLLVDVDILLLEKLDAKEMRKRSKEDTKKQTVGRNRRLAKIKPYAQTQFIKQRANKTGKTLILVDPYKTSQVEYGTDHQEKHELKEREWISSFSGKKIDRDYNAGLNIRDWGLNPSRHIKHKEYPKLVVSKLAVTN